jgi:hypothetical protein
MFCSGVKFTFYVFVAIRNVKSKFDSSLRDFALCRTRKQTSLHTLTSINDVTDLEMPKEFENFTDACLFRCSEMLLMIIILWSLNWHGICFDVLNKMQHKLVREFWLRAKSIADQCKRILACVM